MDSPDPMLAFVLRKSLCNRSSQVEGAEGVGLLPTNRKALKINERSRRYVLQDYRTSVPVGNGEFFRSEPIRFPKCV
jgi:hypothetical protein